MHAESASLIEPEREAPSARDVITGFTLAKIDHFLFAPSETVYPDLKKLCDTVSDSYRDRVVVELLQNAHDAHDATATNGRIHMLFAPDEGDWGALYVANDGDGFAEANFRALCSPTRTTKTVNEAIGNKGVGFLSTFQVCAHPEIYSRASARSAGFDGFCFKFGEEGDVAALLAASGRADRTAFVFGQMPRLYLACPVEAVSERLSSFAGQGFATVIRLPLKNQEAKLAVMSQLEKLIAGDPPVHLFLTRLAELSIDQGDGASVLGRDPTVLRDDDGFRLQEVGCAKRRYILAQREIPHEVVMSTIARDVEAQLLPTNWLEWSGNATISLAVAMDGEPLVGRIYNFLPMGAAARAPFAGHLDAPFYATIERLNVQVGVGLNHLFMATAQSLAIEAAQACRDLMKPADAQLPVIDLLAWTGEGRVNLLDTLILSEDALIPVIGATAKSRWAALADVRRWPDDDFLTPKRAAAVSSLSILDPTLGADRLTNLATFGGQKIRLAPNWPEKRSVAQGVAADLHRDKAAIAVWNDYYRALARFFTAKPDQLLGLPILLSERYELVATEAPAEPTSKRRPKRLSAMFLPPLRANEGRGDLPRAVRQRLAYLHRELELSLSSAAPARSMLVMGGIVREHQAREILRLLASAIDDTGGAVDPEGLRWEALAAVMRIARDEEVADTVIGDLNLRIPGKTDWMRADTAYFGRGWQGTGGARLEALFEEAHGLSAELDTHAGLLLRPYRDWPVPAGSQADWVTFLRNAGVRDHLRPIAAFNGPAPRADFGPPFDEMRRRAALPADQTLAWTQAVGTSTDYPNPFTAYTVSGGYRLPGQTDFAALAPIVGRLYAEQVLRVVDAEPERLKMHLFRPNHSQRHERQIASPVEAFVRGASWIPTVRGLMPLHHAWIGSESRTPPPGLPTVDYEFRTLMLRHETADTELRGLGMPSYGAVGSAARFLVVAGAAISEGLDGATAERWLSAAQEAWSRVDLIAAPSTELRVLCRADGAIVAVDPREATGPLIIIADGDDRQLLAAKMRTQQAFAIFEPPPTRLADVAGHLHQHFPFRMLRASSLRATYVAGDLPVTFDPSDPLIEVELGDRLREIVALTVRYNNAFFRTDVEEVLQRLAAIRIRWLDGLSVQVGELVQPVANFKERGIFLPGDGPTILAHRDLRGSERLLIKIAEALAEGLGSRRLLTNSLVALIAQLDGDPLHCTYADLARVLQLPEDQIRGALGVTRAAIGSLLIILRPVVAYYCGQPAAQRFVPGGGLLTEGDIASALLEYSELPEDPATLIRRCREASGMPGLASALRVDLARFNAVLEALGAPYAVVDMAIEHAASLQIFLDKRATVIRDSIRATFWHLFDGGDDLTAYVSARDTTRPALPDGFGRDHIDLPRSTMETWLNGWLDKIGVKHLGPDSAALEVMEAVQAANLRLLRQLAPRMRRILLARVDNGHSLGAVWGSEASAQQSVTAAAEHGGWIDFDRLDGPTALPWLKRAGLWPVDWPDTLDLAALNLDEAALEAVRAADEAARLAAAAQPRSMAWAGGAFRFGMDSWAEAADAIAGMADGNSILTATTTRVAQGIAPKLTYRPGGGGSGGGSPGSRMTQDERDFVGFCGEAVAFAWIRKRFGKGRVIDHGCWRSSYSEYVTSRKGDNSLGYDFEVSNGATTWYFEVKSTSGQGPQAVQSIELGSTEIARAEACKADGRHRFRILYVTDALQPARARLFVLPNPRGEEGKRFFAEPATTGLRLVFGLPT